MRGMHSSEFSRYLLIFVIVNTSLYGEKRTSGVHKEDVRFGSGGIRSVVATLIDDAASSVQSKPVEEVNTLTTQLPRMRPPRLKLNKCCRYNEHLDSNQTCVMGNKDLWVPLIFLINLKTYFTPQGAKPKFITFEENVRPISNGDVEQNFTSTNQNRGCTWDELEYFTGSGNLVLFSNGSLFLRERALLIEPQHYCVDRDTALVCFPRQRDAPPRIKIRKCCGWGGSYDASKKICEILSNMTNQSSLELPLNSSVFETVYGFPECQDKNTPYAIAGNWNEIQLLPETGHLQLPHKNISTSEYCIEHLREGNTIASIKVFTCLHHFVVNALGNGITPVGSTPSDQLQTAVLNVGITISVVFLGATLVAGYMMPSVHHALHWRCQIYYVFCLFVGDLIFAYTQFSHSLEFGSFACSLLASAMHFFFLAAFFWLNTMCFNIWWTFRDFRPSSLERNQELLRLRLYSAYAWGVPLLISVIALTVDHLPETQLLRPGFGIRSCWFSGEHLSTFAYFFGPVGLLLLTNIILFISTTHQLTCGLWKRDDVKSTTEKTALGKVCLKLVVVMGVTWIADIISWLAGGPHSLWFFTDLINALQGVFIFIVVGCQPQVWSACRRICCPRSRQEITNTTNGVQHSSSSQGLPSMGACGAEITQNSSINTTIGGNQTQTKMPMETVC